jgi:hypothetical protein
MGSIPGPILRFQIDAPGLNSAVTPALDTMKNQARQASQQIVADWQRSVAQLRASISSESLGLKSITAERQRIIGMVDQEMAALRTKESLTTKELSLLKAMTLERERQADAIKRGAAVGVTGGTTSALNQVSTQTVLGLERVMDSLVNRFFGGAAGALFRTARDVQYYSAQAASTRGASTLLSNLTGGTGLAVLGGTAGLALAGSAIVKMSVDGGKLAVELDNLARRTGVTTDEIVKLRSAAAVLDIPLESATTGFRKLDQELTLALSANLPGASKQAQQAGELFKALGVNVQQAARDPFAAISQLASVFRQLPDGAVKSSLAVTLFGRGGLELVPILDKLAPALDATKQSSQDLARALGTDTAHSAEALKAATVNMHNEWDALEVSLAKNVLPALVSTVTWFNSVADAARRSWNETKDIGPRIEEGIVGQLRAQRQQLTPAGQTRLDQFIEQLKEQQRGDAGTLQRLYVQNPLRGTAEFQGSLGSDFSKYIEKFTGNLQSAGQGSKAASTELDQLARILGKTGDGSREAARRLEEFNRMIEQAVRSHPGLSEQQRFDQDLYKTLGPSFGIGATPRILVPPSIGGFAPTGNAAINANPLAGLTAAISGPSSVLGILKQIDDEHDTLFTTQREKDLQHYAQEFQDLDAANKAKLISTEQYNEAREQLQDNLNKTLEDLNKKYYQEAGSLFDTLISGKSKDFSKQLEKDIEDIVLAPFKKQFEQLLGGMLASLGNVFNPGGGTSTKGAVPGGTTSTAAGGWLSKIFGPIFGPSVPTINPNAPGGTAPFWPGPTGLPGSTTPTAGPHVAGSVAIQAGQAGVSTPTMNVQAQVVNVTGPSGPGGTPTQTPTSAPVLPPSAIPLLTAAAPLTDSISNGVAAGASSAINSTLTPAIRAVSANVPTVQEITSTLTPALRTISASVPTVGNILGIPSQPSAPSGGNSLADFILGSLGVKRSAAAAPPAPVPVVFSAQGGQNLFSGAFGNFLGNNNPVAGPFGALAFGGPASFGNFFGNLNPYGTPLFGGTSTSSGTPSGGLFAALNTPLGQALGGVAGGLLVGGLGAEHGNVAAEATGAATVATGLAKAASSLGVISSKFAGQLGQGFQGASLLASGISKGGVTGGLEDVAGGAEIGTAIAPGIGTAVGAIAGALVGIFNGIFGGSSWQSNVQKALNNQSIYLPPSESFQFASNGSIGSTLSTSYAQSGNTFTNFTLPQGTPFWANPVYGPLTNAQKQQLQQTLLTLNANQPFLGQTGLTSTSPNPFLGQGIPSNNYWPGSPLTTPLSNTPPNGSTPGAPIPTPPGQIPGGPSSGGQAPTVQVHFNLPGVIDAASIGTSLGPHAETIARIVATKLGSASSGMSTMVQRLAYLP